jgi:hypothetical protein
LSQIYNQTEYDPMNCTKGQSNVFYTQVTNEWIKVKGYLKYNEPMTEADVRTDLGEKLGDLSEMEKQRIQTNRDQCVADTHYVRSSRKAKFAIRCTDGVLSQRIGNWYRYNLRTKTRDRTILPAVREFNRTLKEVFKPSRSVKEYERYAEMYAAKLAPQLNEVLKDVPRERFLAAREAFLQRAFRNETTEVRQEVLQTMLVDQVAEDAIYHKRFQNQEKEVAWAR